jgi:hypothetical protein
VCAITGHRRLSKLDSNVQWGWLLQPCNAAVLLWVTAVAEGLLCTLCMQACRGSNVNASHVKRPKPLQHRSCTGRRAAQHPTVLVIKQRNHTRSAHVYMGCCSTELNHHSTVSAALVSIVKVVCTSTTEIPCTLSTAGFVDLICSPFRPYDVSTNPARGPAPATYAASAVVAVFN